MRKDRFRDAGPPIWPSGPQQRANLPTLQRTERSRLQALAYGMDNELEAAFRSAHYRVATPAGELLLRVDERNEHLAALLREAGATQAALLTAFNPLGKRRGEQENRATQAVLVAGLAAAGHRLLQGRNADARGDWAEDSVLVLGIDRAAARDCAACFGQAAFLWIDAAATPRLVGTAAPLS